MPGALGPDAGHVRHHRATRRCWPASLASPLLHRLNLGPLPTWQVSWDQPHEGNLFEHLYVRRAVQGRLGAA